MGTGIGNTVGKNVSAEQADLDLDEGDLGDLHSLMDSGGRNFAEGDGTDKTLVNVLLNGAKGNLQRDLGITTGALEEVNLLAALEQLQTSVDGTADLFRRARVPESVGVDGTLDAEEHFVGIFRVLGEVALEKSQ